LAEHEIRVVDRSGHEQPEGQEGRVQFRGPSACRGYIHNPEGTEKLFDGDWLDSGDLGYVRGGDIFITGRSKDLIIVAGRNIYPQELEEAVAELPGIRKGNVVVFGVTDEQSGTERVIVLAETRETESRVHARLRTQINELAIELIGIPPQDTILASPQTVPKTSSGKIRRSTARELYQQGLLGAQQKLWKQYLHLAAIGAMGQLRRGLQSLARLSFAVWAWTLFALLTPCVYAALLLFPAISWRWSAMRLALGILRHASGTSVSIQGLENLPEGPCIMVANHASYLDGYALTAMLPRRVSYVAKRELAASILLRLPLERIGTEFVERLDKQKGIEDARYLGQRASEGCSLMFFPEGTFSRSPGLQGFHMGAFVAAVESHLPVVPIAIRGTRSILRGNDKFPRRGAISIHIGEPLSCSENSETSKWSKAIDLRDRSRRYILDHCGEPDLAAR
jgi:1-acyl-sn-glycerol-3-phosphate acyltransferase